MNISNFIKKIPKFWQSHGDHGYRIITYANKNESEEIWNGTNLIPPSYIISRNKKDRLYLKNIASKVYLYYPVSTGNRYFTYQTEEDYFSNKDLILRTYWNNNLFNCNEVYSSYNEYYKHNKGKMSKRKLKLIEKTNVQ